jgi:phosphoribosylanthranilate isomerase
MEPTTLPRIKVCCISSIDEAWLAIRHGASALGLVSQMPSGPGVIADALIAEIAAAIPPGIASFLLTSRQDVDGIVEQQRRARVNAVQIVDRLEQGTYVELRERMPGVAIVQVIHVHGEASVEEAMSVAPEVSAILLDSGNQRLAVKELGGTGRRHDWRISARIREAVPVPIFLAGGLNPENVAEAIAEVRPFGLDICSGLRTEGRLDEAKLERFVTAIAQGSVVRHEPL